MGFVRQFIEENYDIEVSEDFEHGFIVAANVLGYAPSRTVYKLDALGSERIKALLEPDSVDVLADASN